MKASREKSNSSQLNTDKTFHFNIRVYLCSSVALFLYLAFSPAISAADLAGRIDKLLAESPAAFWGIEIRDLKTGEVVYSQNQNKFFVPASNTKLFTIALALDRLGPNYTFTTRVVADASADQSGRIAGDLRLVGGGDPDLSARTSSRRTAPKHNRYRRPRSRRRHAVRLALLPGRPDLR